MSISVYKLPTGKWRADVAVGQVRRSKVHRLKGEAQDWARSTERALLLDAPLHDPRTAAVARPVAVTVTEAFRAYAASESPLKKTGRKEAMRIEHLLGVMPFADWPLATVTSDHLGRWQQSRRHLSAHTILRDYSLLGAIFEWCRVSRKWLVVNPVPDAWKPATPPHRERRVHRDEILALLGCLGYQLGSVPGNKSQETGLIWLIAMATGMRSGEVVNRLRGEVSLSGRFVLLPDTKNGRARRVPLDELAVQLWALALAIRPEGLRSERVWTVTDASRDALWRKARCKAGLDDVNLRFHDSRHEAASLFAKRIPNALTLCKVMGWSKTDQALTYYNPSNDELVELLDSAPQHRVLRVGPA